MEKKGFKEEFKEFILRGNVMDMAVGVIIGGAFKAIVDSLVADIITPIIGMVTGGVDFTSLSVKVGEAELTYGNFIQSIISFLLIALVIFWMVKGVNKARAKKEEPAPEPEPAAEPEPDPNIVLLTEIRDLLKK
ncbi:MAG: large-conductance mechanosensitive channel protein MscL [Mogibacterium sp.]|nr:large-conductance mechanosensitive channel protein MscL [Mogibacterium sp.]